MKTQVKRYPSHFSARESWLTRRRELLRFFDLSDQGCSNELEGPPPLTTEGTATFEHYGFDWYFVPPTSVLPFDERYVARLYPGIDVDGSGSSIRELMSQLAADHERIAGRWVAVERTQKPAYLPDHHQLYGTQYGFADADPLSPYLTSGQTRFVGQRADLKELIAQIGRDWNRAGWLPRRFEVALCPPTAFNIVGTIFHREWSATASLEIGSYGSRSGEVKYVAVGSQGPGDFSFIRPLTGDDRSRLCGFRLALIEDHSDSSAR